MIEVRQISTEETYSIRHRILRPNQTIEDCKYPNDFAEKAFHLGGFVNDELLGIASFYQENHANFADVEQYRLRGMATLEEHQGKGIGTKLLLQGINEIAARKGSLLWCNARVSGAGFYERNGLKQSGDIFDIPPIGLHKVMYIYC